MATLMSDEVFHDVAYKAKNRTHLLAGIDEFLDAVTVLPPGEWDPTIRIEPPAAIPSQVSQLYQLYCMYIMTIYVIDFSVLSQLLRLYFLTSYSI